MTVELEITDATQFATAYQDGKPVATLARRRAYEKGPAWKVYDMQGALMFRQPSTDIPQIIRRIERRIAAPVKCAAFVLCENPATLSLPHPILGHFASCARCAAKLASLS